MTPAANENPLLRRLVPWLCNHGTPVLFAVLLLAMPAAYRTAVLYLHLSSDLSALLPPNAPSVQALDELRARTGGGSYLGVVVEAAEPAEAPALRRFIDALAGRVSGYPKDVGISRVAAGDQDEEQFFEQHAGIYVDTADLEALRERLEARRSYEVAKQLGTLLDEDEAPPKLGLDELTEKYQSRALLGRERRLPGGRFETADGRTAVLLIELGRVETGTEAGRALMNRVRADIAALLATEDGPGSQVSRFRIGFAGDVAARVEELEALVTDLTTSSIVVILAVSAVILLYYRFWQALIVLVVPLLAGTAIAFALCTFPPLGIRTLNSNTAFLGSIIVGNGVNSGIILLARYDEGRRSGARLLPSLVTAYEATWRATLTAAAAAALAYGSLVTTTFRGFSQFGWIGAFGMLLSWLCTMLLVPPLLSRLDRAHPVRRPSGQPPSLPFVRPLLERIVHLVQNHATAVLAVALVGTGLSSAALATASERWIESDYGQMRRRDTWAHGEGYWGQKMNTIIARYLTPAVILTSSYDQTRRVAAAVNHDIGTQGNPLSEIVLPALTVDDLIPPNQGDKIELLRAIDRVVTPRMRRRLSREDQAQLDRFLSPAVFEPVTGAELPDSLVGAMRDRNGRLGAAVLVFPYPSVRLWEASRMRQLTTELRSSAERATLPGEPVPKVAGSVMLSYDLLEAIAHDGPRVTALAFFLVLGVVVAAFGLTPEALLVAGSLIMAALWLTGILRAFDVKLNFANFVAFPITFGIGADYAVNVIGRYRADSRRGTLDVNAGPDVHGLVRAIRNTGGAVVLASLTTVIGYSSLLLARNRALFLFGAMAVLGELAAVTTAIVVLPSALLVLRARSGSARVRPLL